MLRLGILISGEGTTYAAIAAAAGDGRIAARIARVISSRADAGGVARALSLGHPVTVVDPKDPAHHRAVADVLAADGVDLVIMAGWLHLWKIPPEWVGRTINTHPALIPAFSGRGFYGRRVHEAVMASGARISGCTVHAVDGEYDHGPILEQRAVPVEWSDSPESLAAKVQAIEKSLLIHVIQQWPVYRERAARR